MRQLSFSDDLAPQIAVARRAVGNRPARRIWARSLLLRLLRERARLLGVSTFILGLILVGASLSDKMGEFRNDIGLHVMAASVVLRLGLLGFLFVLLAKYVPGSIELKRVLLIQSAMPAAMFPIILAKRYDGDVICALQVAIATTLVSLVTIPLWIPFWMNWVGL